MMQVTYRDGKALEVDDSCALLYDSSELAGVEVGLEGSTIVPKGETGVTDGIVADPQNSIRSFQGFLHARMSACACVYATVLWDRFIQTTFAHGGGKCW
jgi:hypothetical protein